MIDLSKYWSVIARDILKNAGKPKTLPSLETVNTRLNIFRAKIEKVNNIN